jgi:hypothetical protein
MMRRFVMGTAVLALLVGLVAVPAQAYWTTVSNFDVYNYTGQTVNDFHLKLTNVPLAGLGALWTGSYPTVSTVGDWYWAEATWTGASTPNGGHAHFGANILYTGGSSNYFSSEYWWTKDGVRLTNNLPPPPNGGVWWHGIYLTAALLNPNSIGTSSMWVERRTNVVDGPVLLDDLMVDSPIWNSATIVDQQPVEILPGQALSYDFVAGTAPLDSTNYVMMYNVYEDNNGAPGPLVATFLNAISVPEPSTLALLGIGAVNLLAYALRRRRS